MKSKILIVEDQEAIGRQIRKMLEKEGYEVDLSTDGLIATRILEEKRFNLIISDLKIPHISGLDLLTTVKTRYLDTDFIVMTAYGSIETAVCAMKKGATDYITKPFSPEELVLTVRNVIAKQNLVDEVKTLRKEVEGRYSFGNIIGKNPKMQEVYNLISDVADTDATVLIRGETGTGKELVAKSIHFNSRRKDNAFVSLNCAALPETLLESEIFGYEKGAFTGAIKQKIGKFEYADGGTIFLDEVSDLSPTTQVKLLRVLQERVIERVGGNGQIQVDVRIIAATNKDLEEEVEQGRFREDLYYRLNVVPIKLPPLRERKEDLPLLAKHFLAKYTQMLKKDINIISQDVLNQMMAYDWPGNVRQLENLIERSIIMTKGKTITNIDLSDDPRKRKTDLLLQQSEALSFKEAKERLVREYEKEYFISLLRRCRGNITQSAKISHLDMKTLRRKMMEYSLRKEDFKIRE